MIDAKAGDKIRFNSKKYSFDYLLGLWEEKEIQHSGAIVIKVKHEMYEPEICLIELEDATRLWVYAADVYRED